MSYDLFFRHRPGKAMPSTDDLAEFFRDRPSYLEDQPGCYSNETTGVYFSFDIGDEPEPEGSDGDSLPVAFNLNYCRPHIFGLEAEIEVGAFVKQFDLLVSDPQDDGMGDGEYSREGFLRGWNAGNAFGYKALSTHMEETEQPYCFLPSRQIEACWRWNYGRDRLEAGLEDIFVPRIIFLNRDGRACSTVIWGDAVGVALPAVDIVLVPRKELAPGAEDMAVVPGRELGPLLQSFPRKSASLDYHVLDYAYGEAPRPVTDFVRRLRANKENLQAVAIDQILDEEIWNSARK